MFSVRSCVRITTAVLACAVAMMGCQPWQTAAHNLDVVGSMVEEYGTVTVSEPLLLPNDHQFKMDRDKPVDYYIEQARTNVQGTERDASITALEFATSLQLQADISSQFNPFANPLAAPSTQPTTAPTGTIVGLPTSRPAAGALPAFSAVLPASTQPTALSERELLKIGFDDKATEILLRNLFDPQKFGSNKRLYLGLIQISCQPGWRTREGYFADVNVSVGYARRPSVGHADQPIILADTVPGRPQPLILSVFPSLEAQTLDLRNSIRSRVTMALELAAMLRFGPANAQARQLIDYARQLEQDSTGRTALPIVTSYSDGANFGYQIRPAFQAIGNLTSLPGKPAEVLQPSSFPAVVLLVCDEADLKGGGWTDIVFSVSSRWVPANPAQANSFAHETEARRLQAAVALDNALAQLLPVAGASGGSDSNVAQELKRRVKLYESLGMGITRYSSLPPVTKPAKAHPLAIDDVQPKLGWRNADTTIVVTGIGFMKGDQPVVKKVIVGGVDCTNLLVLSDKALVAVVPKGSFDVGQGDPIAGQKQAVTVLTGNGARTSPPAIAFTANREWEAPAPSLPTGIDVHRDNAGKIDRITLPQDGSVSSEQLLEVIGRVLRSELDEAATRKLLEELKSIICCPKSDEKATGQK